MMFHSSHWCSGNQYWLQFKQGEYQCRIKQKESSTRGVTEQWKSIDSELDTCAPMGFNLEDQISVRVESSDDNQFCPRQIIIFLDGHRHWFKTESIPEYFTDYSDPSNQEWLPLTRKS